MTVKKQTIQAQLDSVIAKLDALEKIYPKYNQQGTKNVIVSDVVKKPVSLWSADSLKHTKSAKSNLRAKVKYPEVLDHETGKWVRYDKFLDRFNKSGVMDRHYATDEVPFNPNAGGMPLNAFNFAAVDFLIDNWFLGYSQYSLLTQNSLLYKVCDVKAQELVRKGWEFRGTDEDVSEDLLLELTKEVDRLGAKQVLRWAGFLTYTMGGCLVYPKLKGDEEDLTRETPIAIDETCIGKGDLEYIKTIEPIWYVPIKWNAIDPFSKWFYEPEFYTVFGKITHSSRVWKMIQNQNPNLLRPVYQFNGIPMMGQMIPWVTKFEQMYNNVLTIVSKLNLGVLNTDQSAIIYDNGKLEESASNLANRVQIAAEFRDNTSILALAKDEKYEQVSMTLAGLDTLLTKSLEYVAIIPGTPIVKLFGNSPAGMNASGEFEMKNHYDQVACEQETMIKPILTNIMHCAMLNKWGKINDKITFEFNKLEETNPLEDAQIRQINAQTDDIYIQNQTLGQPDVQKRLAADPSSGYNELEIDEEDLDKEINMIMPQDPEEEDL